MPEPDTEGPATLPSGLSAVFKRRKRPDIIADKVRDMIIAQRLVPGDRVPHEWLSPQTHGASRGTLREAQKILEIQGLTTSKTGPGGGVFVSRVGADQAIRLLDNLFVFQPPSIADIYAIRKQLEPLLAASLAGKLSPDAFAALQETIRLYEDEAKTAEQEYAQRLAELDFHVELARRADNALLGFVCIFLVSLLRDMTTCRAIYQEANPTLRETGLNYQIRLLRAIKAGDAERAFEVMREHMIAAEAYMLERAEIVRG